MSKYILLLFLAYIYMPERQFYDEEIEGLRLNDPPRVIEHDFLDDFQGVEPKELEIPYTLEDDPLPYCGKPIPGL